jgi:hypothetical protein
LTRRRRFAARRCDDSVRQFFRVCVHLDGS